MELVQVCELGGWNEFCVVCSADPRPQEGPTQKVYLNKSYLEGLSWTFFVGM
jgi:hypothetical protein